MTSSDYSPIETSENTIKQLHVYYKKMIDAKEHWGIKEYRRSRQLFFETLDQVISERQTLEQNTDAWLLSIQQQIENSDYLKDIESLLSKNKITFTGKFPEYSIPPFKLVFNLHNNSVRLSMGRKSHQTFILEPQSLVHWINKHYEPVVSSSFEQEQFCKEIMSAYKLLSQSHWRRQISLKDVYQVLTIRGDTKQEYPESIFMFDLARLLQNPMIELDDFYFEFAPHKETKKNYFITDTQGKEKTIGLVSIYPKQSRI
jgi:hypothetical protein